MDIAGLSKLTSDTLVLIVSILGFLVGPIRHCHYDYSNSLRLLALRQRSSRLLRIDLVSICRWNTSITPSIMTAFCGCDKYLMSLRRGYAEKGDARQFHPKLRPPVNPEELEIDPRTGMKVNFSSIFGKNDR